MYIAPYIYIQKTATFTLLTVYYRVPFELIIQECIGCFTQLESIVMTSTMLDMPGTDRSLHPFFTLTKLLTQVGLRCRESSVH
jgi:hypothetical protein